MIKVIAFDLVGVLVRENDYKLNEIQSKIERLFGPNKSDEEFIECVKKSILNASNEEIIKLTKEIIFSIYDTKITPEDLNKLKEQFAGIKLVVATNHLSFVNEYILNTFNNIFDNIYISAIIHETKPNKEFYIKMLFLDDSTQNVQGAINCGINAIHVTKDTNILKEVEKYL